MLEIMDTYYTDVEVPFKKKEEGLKLIRKLLRPHTFYPAFP